VDAEEAREMDPLEQVTADLLRLRPSLTVQRNPSPSDVDAELTIPSQPGLPFEIWLSIKGDELHLAAGAFWLEWFPSTDPTRVAEYHDAVVGLVSGRYRIVEVARGGTPVKAVLQRPGQTGWESIGSWHTLKALWTFGPRSERVLQAVHPGSGGTAA
jgi:hypothetical protein